MKGCSVFFPERIFLNPMYHFSRTKRYKSKGTDWTGISFNKKEDRKRDPPGFRRHQRGEDLMETYCGRDCDSCASRTSFGCKGCVASDGHLFYGDCPVVPCCKGKNLTSCATCVEKEQCGLLRECGQRADERLRQWRERLDRMQNDAPVLGKWLWVMFWLTIPSMLASLMSNEKIVALYPRLEIPVETVSLLCGLMMIAALWKLSAVHRNYRTAAYCTIGGLAISLATLAMMRSGISTVSGVLALAFILSIAAIVVALCGTYYTYLAHAEVLTDVDQNLSDSWRQLWKWYVWLMIAMVITIFLMFASTVLAAILLIIEVVGLVCVAVAQLIYLYKTAKTFREYHMHDYDSPDSSDNRLDTI